MNPSDNYSASQLVRVSKIFSFDMAHALYGYDGPCKNIHGHTYHLHITLRGFPNPDRTASDAGMVADFRAIKSLVKQSIIDGFDHALVLQDNVVNRKNADLIRAEFEKIILIPIQPTCENLMLHFRDILLGKIPENVELVYMKLQETPGSYSEWFLSDNI